MSSQDERLLNAAFAMLLLSLLSWSIFFHRARSAILTCSFPRRSSPTTTFITLDFDLGKVEVCRRLLAIFGGVNIVVGLRKC